MTRRLIGAMCALAVAAILVATLRPFHSPKNQVSWVPNEDAVRIGRNGTMLSSGTFRPTPGSKPSCSLEVWIEPAFIWRRATVLSFYHPQDPLAFLVNQNDADLVLQRGTRSHRNNGQLLQIEVPGVFRKRQIFLTVTSNGHDTAVYINGQLVTSETGFGLSAQDLSGQLIVANSPLRDHSWSGQLRGLAVFYGTLSPSEIAQRYENWKERRESPDANDGRAVAFYAFHERRGRIIHDEGTAGIDLHIPEQFLVVDHILLEPPSSEIHGDDHYFRNGLNNIAGFIPLGFLLTAYFALCTEAKRPALVAIIIGGSLSLGIEVLQAYIPTRFSGMTDIITNTFGTALGAAFYRAAAQVSGAYLFRSAQKATSDRGIG